MRNWHGPALIFSLTAAGIVGKGWYFHWRFGDNWSFLPWPDEVNYYLSTARLIQQQGLHFFTTERSLWTAPLNPLWILAWRGSVVLAKWANVGLLAWMGLLVWSITRRMFGAGAALIALALCSAQWRFAEIGFSILTEPLFTFLLVACFWFICRPQSSALSLSSAGAALGLAALTRPTVEILPVLLLASAAAIAARRGDPIRTACRPVAWLGAGFVVIVLPLLLKNEILFRRPVIANGALGAALFLGNNLKTDGDEPIYSGLDFNTTPPGEVPLNHLSTEGDRRLIAAGLREIREHPWQCLTLTVRKIPRFLLGYPESYFFPQRDLISAWQRRPAGEVLARLVFDLLTTVFAVVFGVVGLILSPRGLPRLFTVVLIVTLVAVHAITFAIPRLSLPIYPFFAIFAGGAFSRLRHWEWAAVVPSGSAIAVAGWIALADFQRPVEVVSQRYADNFAVVREIRDFGAWNLHHLRRTDRGILSATGEIPYLEGPIDPVSADRNEVFFLSITIVPHCDADRGHRYGLVRWTDGNFADDQVVGFEMLVDGERHLYRITPTRFPGWKGRISLIRLELPSTHPGTDYQIRSFSLAK